MANRREFLARSAQGVAAAACVGSIWYGVIAQQATAAPHALRPPGAIADGDFAATCAKCGRCVVACPFGTLKLADLAAPGPIGLPYFEPRDIPCYMCADLPCVNACPTGALDRSLTDVAQSRMGIAVIDAESCLSWRGLRCEVCYRVCPERGPAIRIEPHPRQVSRHAVFVPVVSSGACTGCGLCEHACPTEIPAVRVVRAKLVKGRIGDHYRLGEPTGGSVPSESAGAGSPPVTPSEAPRPRASAPGLDYLNRGMPP